jgi:threonyl-tRNA synthetase
MLVVGEKDAAEGTVTVRDRLEGDVGAMPIAAAIDKLRAEVAAKTVRQVAEVKPAVAIDRGAANEY